MIIDVHKPDNGSLGITLEGTIDVESGEEIGSHHYIRTVLPDGIIGREGTLKSGDELLEVTETSTCFVFVSSHCIDSVSS